MHSRSSSPDVPLVNLKGPRPPPAVHNNLDTSSEWSPDGKQDNQEHSEPEIASSTAALPSAERLQPVLTSLDPSATARPRHAAKRPSQVRSTQSSRSPSPSSRAKARYGRSLRGCGRGGKQLAGKGGGRGSGRGSKQRANLRAGYEDQSLSSTSTDSTDEEESATSPDDDAKPHKQTTWENSVCTGHDSGPSFSVSCVDEISPMDASTIPRPEPVIRATSPQDSVIPDPTTLVSQFNLTNGQSQQLLSSRVVPNLGIEVPPSTTFESRQYLNGLEDPGSAITFHGEVEQVIDGHFLESLTHGLYGSLTDSCLDSDLMPTLPANDC